MCVQTATESMIIAVLFFIRRIISVQPLQQNENDRIVKIAFNSKFSYS